MKIDPTFYMVHADIAHRGVALICVTYNYDSARKFIGVEYYELVWSLEEDEDLSIPNSRPATFKEELRVLHQAVSTFEGTRNREKQHIEKKLKEAYGSKVQIRFEKITPNKR